jgi:hypothetical protein
VKPGVSSYPTHKRVEVTNLPNLESEFNILIPLTNTENTYPYNLVIAFSTQTQVSLGVSGYHKIVNVFRVFGPSLFATVSTTALTTINSMTVNSDETLTADFTANWKEVSTYGFNYQIDLSKLSAKSQLTTLIKSKDTVLPNFALGNGQFGSGITVTSFMFNIFEGSSVSFVNAPSNIGACQ